MVKQKSDITTKWLKNLESIFNNNTPNACPCCGSKNTDYSAKKVQGDYGYCVIWCNDCKSAYNASRVRITDNLKTGNIIPLGLRF